MAIIGNTHLDFSNIYCSVLEIVVVSGTSNYARALHDVLFTNNLTNFWVLMYLQITNY